jgi:hypothetical protein
LNPSFTQSSLCTGQRPDRDGFSPEKTRLAKNKRGT